MTFNQKIVTFSAHKSQSIVWSMTCCFSIVKISLTFDHYFFDICNMCGQNLAVVFLIFFFFCGGFLFLFEEFRHFGTVYDVWSLDLFFFFVLVRHANFMSSYNRLIGPSRISFHCSILSWRLINTVVNIFCSRRIACMTWAYIPV